MLGPRLRLKHVLAEEVVLARYDPVVLDVEDFLRKVLALAI